MIAYHTMLFLSSFVLFAAALVLAAVRDAKTRQIPNLVSVLLLAAGIVSLFASGPPLHRLPSALAGAFLGGFPLLILAVFRGAVGGGDVKLTASSGFALGWLSSYLALMTSLIVFVLYGCFRRPKVGKEKAPVLPFAPFYAAAGIGAFVLPVILKIR